MSLPTKIPQTKHIWITNEIELKLKGSNYAIIKKMRQAKGINCLSLLSVSSYEG
jgi:hypothetical protein